MAQETTFDHPPAGHVAIVQYDSVNDTWRAVYVDASGNLQVDVVASGLPTGAATSAKQDTQITALQSLQNLVGALHDVGLDELDIVIAGQDADVGVTQTTPANLVVAQHQYDGTAWRKSNLLWGYNDIWDEDLGGTASTTSYNASATTVPANEVWVLQVASIRNTTRAPGVTYIYLTKASGGVIFLAYNASPGQSVPVLFTSPATLGEGDILTVGMVGIQSGDGIQAGVCGYKMDIDM